MKIAFLCGGNPEDKSLWSGTVYKMYESLLEEGHEILWIQSDQYTSIQINFVNKLADLHEKLLNRTFNRYQTLLKGLISSNRINRILSQNSVDLIFAVGCINELSFLKVNQPIIYINDILYDQHIGYYPAYQGLGWYSKKVLRFLEKEALKKCEAVILPSEWSVNRVISYYNIPKEKVHLLRFGANIDVPTKNEFIQYNKQLDYPITFLFLSVEWERKRGDLAFQTVKLLADKGYRVKLKVVGCISPIESELIEVIPFLNKNNLEDYQKLKNILSSSHFLFVPTEAECYGIVFCEASAYGLPNLTTATGGVTSIVKDGINGFALPLEAEAEDYAKTIEPYLLNEDLYSQLSKSSRERYDEFLNWDKWKKDLEFILNKII